MKTAYVFLAPGFEESEAIGTIDVLRRAEIRTILVAVNDTLQIKGAHDIVITAEKLIEQIDITDADALVLPGGMPGAENLKNNEKLGVMLREIHAKGNVVAAICAAPMVLGYNGLLQGRCATCYPGFESHLTGATHTHAAVEVDGNIITGKGPAFAYAFGLAIAAKLQGDAIAKEVAAGMLL